MLYSAKVLPSAMGQALGKPDIFAECQPHSALGKAGGFVECHDCGTRQSRRHRFPTVTCDFSLPSARQMAFGKEVFADNFFPSAPCRGRHSAKKAFPGVYYDV
jgi:hypothetical protein